MSTKPSLAVILVLACSLTPLLAEGSGREAVLSLDPPVEGSEAARGPLQVGEEMVMTLRSPRVASAPGARAARPVWTQEIYYPEATYICPHFERLKLPEGASLIVRSPDGSRSWTYPDPGKAAVAEEGFWGIHIHGDRAVVELYSSTSLEESAVVIDKFAHGFAAWESPSLALRAICGTDNSKEARCYTSVETLYRRSRTVARLLIGGVGGCTGWLVGTSGHVMTNQHCIGSSSAAANTNFEFIAEGANCSSNCKSSGACPGVVVATSSTLIKANASLDYSLVLLPTNPTGTYGYLKMRNALPSLNERIYIPQHPQFWGKRLAVESTHSQDQSGFCEIFSTSQSPCTGGPGDIGYFADTQGGSSGSPVIAYNDHNVVSLHHCANCPNRGLRTTAIISDLGGSLPPNSVATACNGTSGQWAGCRGTGCHVCSEKVASHPLYFKNHPECISNPTCAGLYFTCNSKCPQPGSADQCNGTSGQWAGCRGTGCHVCAEKVANYPCYFRNHPWCIPNSTCGGLYFTCNANCPAPTAADQC